MEILTVLLCLKALVRYSNDACIIISFYIFEIKNNNKKLYKLTIVNIVL